MTRYHGENFFIRPMNCLQSMCILKYRIVKGGSGKSINPRTIYEIVYDVMKNSCSESIDSGTIYEIVYNVIKKQLF